MGSDTLAHDKTGFFHGCGGGMSIFLQVVTEWNPLFGMNGHLATRFS